MGNMEQNIENYKRIALERALCYNADSGFAG